MFETAARLDGDGVTSGEACSVRHGSTVRRNAADQTDQFRGRSFREVSEYSTAGPELARDAAYSRRG
jgi:hypothetical protein